MKIKILKIIVAMLIAVQTIYAQKDIDPTPEDISVAKTLLDKYPKNDIAVLGDTETISFGFDDKTQNVTVNHTIKSRLMNISHRADIHKYEFYNSESEVKELNVKYRNGKKAKFKLNDEFHTSDDIFYSDYRVKYMEIDFPVQGYTYDYEMVKHYKDVKYFTSVFFNEEYPIVKKEITVIVPDWLTIEIKELNFSGFTIDKKVITDTKTKSARYTFTVTDLPAMTNEESAPGPSYMYPHLLIIAKSFNKSGKHATLFNSTADLYKWYRSLINNIDEKPDQLKDKVNELTANAKSDEEKIKKIYYWVQDNIRYIAFEDGLAGFKPDASQNVFNKRFGDCKGMANLTRQMLKAAGFDARLTWIGTKRIAYDYTIPSLCVDNHMICTVMKDGKRYFLDGTEKYNSFGEYAERIQGKEVLIEDGDNFIIDKVPVAAASHNKEIYTANLKIKDESLTGAVNNVMKGESRASFLYGYSNIKTDKKENALEYYLSGGNKNFLVSNIRTSDLSNRDNPIKLEYDATFKNKVSYFDDDIYVNLDYRREYSNLDFKERKSDYEFDYKEDYESIITLEIPDGYKVTRLPQAYVADNGNYLIKTSYEHKGKTVVYKKEFVFKTGAIKTNEFKAWGESLNNLKKNYNEQITLTKI